MLVQSAIVSRGSGSLAGLTWSHNAGGQYLRARVTPTDPGTALQVAVRVIMASLVNLWDSTVTQAQRDDWATYAANTPLLNRFGEPRTVSALNMYTRVNVPRLQAGLARQDNAPVEFNTGAFTNTGIGASEASGISLVFTNTDEWANEDGSAMLFYQGIPQNPTINFYKNPYRFLGKVDGDALIPPTSPATFSPPAFAFAEGQKIFGRVTVVRADGRLSTSQRVETIAVA